ncbi:hypothetical protein [uncultured Desulfobacter sp.]|uniref:hypothetical protein n=1 Tax=uncultured Desulfobacter sp. TaxID=240139 RepID=UPI0029C6E08B|nr:hypothetical protein [uncultured Desulfobacter sp.]
MMAEDDSIEKFRAGQWAPKTMDISQFLVDVLGVAPAQNYDLSKQIGMEKRRQGNRPRNFYPLIRTDQDFGAKNVVCPLFLNIFEEG